jgi:hypothetical protein
MQSLLGGTVYTRQLDQWQISWESKGTIYPRV